MKEKKYLFLTINIVLSLTQWLYILHSQSSYGDSCGKNISMLSYHLF